MSKIDIFALHGFLGNPSDWLQFEFEKMFPNYSFFPYKIGTSTSFKNWAETFNQWAYLKSPNSKRILMGYSMGGRLAVQTLLDNSKLWDQLILISTHPGLKESEAKKLRIKQDLMWAKKFREESWEHLIHSWENQEIFKNSFFRPIRKENDYNREELASQLENFSLGKQNYVLDDLMKLHTPVQWITGSNDYKLEEILKRDLHHQNHIHTSISGCSHRVHFECGKHFFEHLKFFC